MTLALVAASRDVHPGVREVQDPDFWGLPLHTPLTPAIKAAQKAKGFGGGPATQARKAARGAPAARPAQPGTNVSTVQRVRNWFTAPDMSPDAQKVVDGFDPRTFESDQQAGQYALNRAKPGRFERSPIWSGESHEAIANDSITGFHEAQAAIRKGDTGNPQAKAFTARFQRNSTETPDDLLVSRRVAPDAFPGGVEGLAGKEVHDAAYFQGNLGTPIGDAPVLLTVAVPAGTRAMFTGNGPNDRGVILDRDQRLRITKVTPDGKGGWYVAAVAVPKTGTPAGELKEGTAVPDAGALSSDPVVRTVQIENRIRSAYSDMKKAPGGFANMADLRETVDVPRAEFDTAIRRLGNDSDWRVIPVDNRKALSNRDRIAAVRIGEDEANVIAYTPGGRPAERAPLRPLPDAPGTKAARGGPGAPPLLEREAGKRAPGFAQPRGFDEPPTRAAPPTESGRARTPTEIAEEAPAIRQTKQLPADTVAELNDPKTTISRYRDIAREADIKVPARIIKKADIRDFLLGKKGAPPARARGLRVDTPEVETRKLSPEAVGQLNDPKTTVAQLRKIAKDHGIKVPSTATRKADIRAHLMQAGGVKENPPDMLPEGERNRFRAGWREVSKAPEGLAQAELNEIFLDVHGGRLGVIDAARRLENSAGIDREERDRLRARRGDGEPGAEERKLDDEIAAKEKAAKFLRDYRLAEEAPTPTPVKKVAKKAVASRLTKDKREERERDIFDEYINDEDSIEEIAQRRGMLPGSVRRILLNAGTELRPSDSKSRSSARKAAPKKATSSAGTPRAVPRLSRDELEKFNEGQLRVMARNSGVDIPEGATRAETIDALVSRPAPTTRQRGQRRVAPWDPFPIYVAGGEPALRERLATLDVEQLRDIVAAHGMDPARRSARWDRDRLADLVVARVRDRAAKGQEFRPPRGTDAQATAPRTVRQIAGEHGILDDWATMPASQARSDANASLRTSEDPHRIAERLREEADSLESEESPDMTRGISRSEDDIREARDTDVRNLRRLADAIEQEGAPSSIEEDPFPTLTEDQLRNIAQARGIHVPASATKAEIARLISRGGGEMTGSGAVATPHSTVQVRPALAQATGPRTLARATQAKYKRITGRDLAIDFGTDPDLSIPTAREHMEGVLRAAEQWPDVDLREVRWFNGELSEPGKQRPWAISANGAIMFSTAYTSKANRERYLGELADGVAGWDNGGTGFHPRGAATPAAVAMHEFGHLIAPERAARNYPGVLRLVQRRAKEDRVPPSRLIRREVSRYADTNPSELVAEAVLDVLINGDAAGQLARQIVELLRTGRL